MSAKTAIAGLLFDIVLALNAGNFVAIALPGFICTGAVDTLDHAILLQRLQAFWSPARPVEVVPADSVCKLGAYLDGNMSEGCCVRY